jgi:hypothetical protein
MFLEVAPGALRDGAVAALAFIFTAVELTRQVWRARRADSASPGTTAG